VKATAPRKSARIPKLRRHKATGQGYVCLNRRFIYFGRYDAPETLQKYHQIIAEWLANGRQLPQPPEEVTVSELVARYWAFAQAYYVDAKGNQMPEASHMHTILKMLREAYGHSKAGEFGPRALRIVRQTMVQRGWCRRHVNQNVARLKRIFRWGTENELVPGGVYHALQAVAGLRQGRTEARESEPVRPVPQEAIDAVRPHVPRQVWAIIELQLLTAARPGEICIMRPGDIDRTGKIWLYRPESHKTAHRGHDRVIYIGPRGQEVLRPFLLRSPGAYCFSPAEADAERRAALHEQRVTPLSCGNKPGTNRKAEPRKTPGEHYTTNSYRRAIWYACERSFPLPPQLAKRADETCREYAARLRRSKKIRGDINAWRKTHRWSPHRLRHNAATYLRKEFGLDTARVILGHRSPIVTEIYAEVDREKAIEAMLAVG